MYSQTQGTQALKHCTAMLTEKYVYIKSNLYFHVPRDLKPETQHYIYNERNIYIFQNPPFATSSVTPEENLIQCHPPRLNIKK